MKKLIFLFIGIIGLFFISCETSTQKVENAETKVQESQDNLKVAEQKVADAQAQKNMTDEQLIVFKQETELKIKENENRIVELKRQMKSAGKLLDAAYRKNIDALDRKNIEMRDRIDAYKTQNQDDWQRFKSEFTHDMDELGRALKDFNVNYKK